eukprot:3880957-Pyramimonas_sp.AAC.1
MAPPGTGRWITEVRAPCGSACYACTALGSPSDALAPEAACTLWYTGRRLGASAGECRAFGSVH